MPKRIASVMGDSAENIIVSESWRKQKGEREKDIWRGWALWG
jgi:hypothetical protein